MQLYTICIGKHDFLAAGNKRTHNIVKAKKFTSLEQAQQAIKLFQFVEQPDEQILIRAFDITNIDDLLEYFAESIENELAGWGVDVFVNYFDNKVIITPPDWKKQYSLKITEQYTNK